MSDPPGTVDTSTWHRLPTRMLLVHVMRLALALVPIAIAFGLFGSVPGAGALIAVSVAMLFGVARDLERQLTTRYVVDDERVQLRTGLLTTSHVSIPRDRVRAVDVTARPLHRLVGLAVVQIGTGEQARSGSTGDLTLDAIDAAAADELRDQLLVRTREPAPVSPPEHDAISSLQWHWIGWSLLSWWTLALPVVLLGTGYQLLSSIGLDADDVDGFVARTAAGSLRATRSVGIVAAVVLALLAVGIVARLATFVEMWWGFELRRADDGTIRMRRGLLTMRSTSLHTHRIRGAELAEPLLLRPFSVGSATVVTTGLAQDAGSAARADSTALGPPMPLTDVEQVMTNVLECSTPPTRAEQLRAHPVAALRRRLARAAWVIVALIVATFAARAGINAETTQLQVAVAPVLAGLAVAAALLLAYAVDTFRALGHALTDRHVVMRRGSINRRTVALDRAGVIGWIGSSTFFQRRAGLMTLRATTAAGAGAYAIVDLDEDDAVRLANAALPELLTPFLLP